MIVTSIRESGRRKVKVTFDEQFTLVLYKGELKLFSLKEGAEVLDTLPQEIEEKVLNKRACRYAMNLLVKRDYTKKELSDKLFRAGYSSEAAAKALAYVESFGYVDDAVYARRYVETYADRKSRRTMAGDLKQKGVSEEIIALTLEDTDEEEQHRLLYTLARKKARGLDLTQDKDKQRFYRYLIGKGFSYREAAEAYEVCLRNDDPL